MTENDKTTDLSVDRHRRHRVEALLRALRTNREGTRDEALAARIDTVIAVFEAGMPQRRTIVLPDGAGLVDIEQHLGLPDADGDRAAWRRIRREFDEQSRADFGAALYVHPRARETARPDPRTAEHAAQSTPPSGLSGGRTRTRGE